MQLCRGCSSAARSCAPVGAKYTISQSHSTPLPIVRGTRLWSTAVAHHCDRCPLACASACEETSSAAPFATCCILYIRCAARSLRLRPLCDDDDEAPAGSSVDERRQANVAIVL